MGTASVSFARNLNRSSCSWCNARGSKKWCRCKLGNRSESEPATVSSIARGPASAHPPFPRWFHGRIALRLFLRTSPSLLLTSSAATHCHGTGSDGVSFSGHGRRNLRARCRAARSVASHPGIYGRSASAHLCTCCGRSGRAAPEQTDVDGNRASDLYQLAHHRSSCR